MSQVDFHGATIFGAHLSRRGFLAAGGALAIYASLAPRDALAQAAKVTTSPDPTRLLSWIEIRSDNTVQFRTGKCDFGQSSIYIAYPQIIAEELGVPLEAITSIVSGDTDRTPDGGGTFHRSAIICAVLCWPSRAVSGSSASDSQVDFA